MKIKFRPFKKEPELTYEEIRGYLLQLVKDPTVYIAIILIIAIIVLNKTLPNG